MTKRLSVFVSISALVLVLFVMALFLMTVGCTPQTPPDPAPPAQPPAQNGQTLPPNGDNPSPGNKVPNIGGIALGDDIEKVSSIVKGEYTDTMSEVEAYYGPHYIREYDNGLTLVVEEVTGEILQVMSFDPDLTTDLGVGIGDSYETVMQKYKNKYQVPVSSHTGEELLGWFQTADGELVIFDLDDDPSTMFNPEVKSESQVHRIILAYMRYMD